MLFDVDTAYNELHPHFRGRIHRHEPLANHSVFGVGGRADLWVTVEGQKELRGVVCLCAERHWPLLIVGNGTNILFADAGVRGIVARLSGGEYQIEDRGDGTALLQASAGLSWERLLREITPQGWGGLEFAIGIPGTLGAGVVSNVGAHNSNLGRVLEWIEVLDTRGCAVEGEEQTSMPMVRRYLHDELDLGYRYSRFRERRRVRYDDRGHLLLAPRSMIEPAEIVMVLGMRLQRQNPESIRALLQRHSRDRRLTDPQQVHAGSIFKDPPSSTARQLIEQAGMRGREHGKALVSSSNANYFVNCGGASAADFAALITETHHRVLEQSGIELELDLELHGEW